jgi:hypothetical protein
MLSSAEISSRHARPSLMAARISGVGSIIGSSIRLCRFVVILSTDLPP